FPERDWDKWVYVWALNCRRLRGFDTEAYQLGLAGSKQWRPGEKAYHSIGSERVIGYIRVKREGGYQQGCGGWKFRIHPTAKWELNPFCKAYPDQLEYINGELEAWKGSHTITDKYDFAT